jgi:hypothetical protein
VTSIGGSRVFDSRGEVIHVKQEVDPIYEIAGIQKALDKGPVLMFENIKGYPNMVDIATSSAEGRDWPPYTMWDDPKLKLKFVEALHTPFLRRSLPTDPVRKW